MGGNTSDNGNHENDDEKIPNLSFTWVVDGGHPISTRMESNTRKKDSAGDSKEEKDDADKEDGDNNGEDNDAKNPHHQSKHQPRKKALLAVSQCNQFVGNSPSFQSHIVTEAAVRWRTQPSAKQTYANQSLQQVVPEKWQLPESPRIQKNVLVVG